MASQLQAPWSETLASRIMTVPKPSTLVTVTLGGLGMWCQFNLQLIRGVGVPTARQVIVTVSPSVTDIVSGGEETIVGGEQPIYSNNIQYEAFWFSKLNFIILKYQNLICFVLTVELSVALERKFWLKNTRIVFSFISKLVIPDNFLGYLLCHFNRKKNFFYSQTKF